MNEQEATAAHEVYQELWGSISEHVANRIRQLTPEQQEYIIDKLRDEYRFWNVEMK